MLQFQVHNIQSLNVLSLDEIRRASAMFQQWYLFDIIVFDVAPEELQVFMRESTIIRFCGQNGASCMLRTVTVHTWSSQ